MERLDNHEKQNYRTADVEKSRVSKHIYRHTMVNLQ